MEMAGGLGPLAALPGVGWQLEVGTGPCLAWHGPGLPCQKINLAVPGMARKFFLCTKHGPRPILGWAVPWHGTTSPSTHDTSSDLLSLAQRPNLDRHLLSLARSSHLLDLARSDAGLLLFSVRSTADLTEQVSRKVREGTSIDLLSLAQRPDLDRHLLSLARSSHLLNLARSDAGLLLFFVHSTADLAEQVSCKVREVDLAQSRAHSTLFRIDAIVERSHCLDGTRHALDAKDFESAARFVQTFLQIDVQFRESSSFDHRYQLLDCKRQLESIIRRRLAATVDQRDHPSILQFIRIFPPAMPGTASRAVPGLGRRPKILSPARPDLMGRACYGPVL